METSSFFSYSDYLQTNGIPTLWSPDGRVRVDRLPSRVHGFTYHITLQQSNLSLLCYQEDLQEYFDGREFPKDAWIVGWTQKQYEPPARSALRLTKDEVLGLRSVLSQWEETGRDGPSVKAVR